MYKTRNEEMINGKQEYDNLKKIENETWVKHVNIINNNKDECIYKYFS